MKFWIDDIRTPPDNSWHICRDVTSAIRGIYLFWPQIKEINLDHDISHQVVMDGMSRPFPCGETFKAVAIYIATVKRAHPEWNPTVFIHTSNHTGAHEMRATLEDAGIKPQVAIAPGANRLETIL